MAKQLKSNDKYHLVLRTNVVLSINPTIEQIAEVKNLSERVIDVIDGLIISKKSPLNFLEVAVGREYGDKEKKLHWHCHIVFDKDVSNDTLRKRIKLKWGLPFQLAFQKTDNSLMYACKKLHIDYVINLTKEKAITEGKKWIGKDDFVKQLKTTNMLDSIIQFQKKEKKKIECLEDCGEIVYRYYRQENKVMDYYRMKNWARTLYGTILPEHGENDFLMFLNK